MASKYNVIVIGSGIYVLGKGHDDFGVIMPTLVNLQKQNILSKIILTIRRKTDVPRLNKKIDRLSELYNFDIVWEYLVADVESDDYSVQLMQLDKPLIGIVALPDHLHFRAIEGLLKNEIHCFTVKPLTPSVNEAMTLIEMAKHVNVKTGVEFHKRFDVANLYAKRLFQEGKLGTLSNILVEYSQKKRIPLEDFTNWVNQTNIFQYLGVHYVDLIYFITRAMPLKVMAVGTHKLLKENNINGYDTIHVMIKWELNDNSSFFSSHYTSWIDPMSSTAMSHQKIKLIGTSGIYDSDQKERGVSFTTDDEFCHINPYFSHLLVDTNGEYFINGYGPDCITQFILDIVWNDSHSKYYNNYASFAEALVSTAVSEAVSRSLEDGSQWKDVEARTILTELGVK
jgi:D-galacturonate reductase